MSVGLQVWSQTASNNSTADTNINWAEGQAPSSVNDSARAEMASMAKWRDDNNGTLTTSGTTTAYTVTSNQASTGNVDGYTVTVKFHATNDSSATLSSNSNTAANLQLVAGTNVVGGEFLANSIHRFKYDSGSTAWVAQCANLVGSGAIGSFQIADNAVTYQKIQTPGASKLLANPSTSTSTGWREVTLGTNLSFSGTVLNAGNNTPVITTITSTATVTWQSTTQNGNFPLYLFVRMQGTGGGGGAANTNSGTSGVDCSFGTWTAVGGAKGVAGGSGGAGGTGGTNGTGTLIRRFPGGTGGDGSGSVAGIGGSGFGFGPVANTAGNYRGASATGTSATANSGCGGGGGTNGSVGGGGGGAGEYVEFIITSPSTSYSVVLSSAGAGGAAGGAAAGNGAAGYINVIAYWQ